MTITHHPDISTLGSFAFGTIDKGRAFVIAAHVQGCPKCQGIVRGYEDAGGALLEASEPAALSGGATETMLDMVLHGARPERRTAPKDVVDVDLRTVLTTFSDGPWRWLGPGVRYRSLADAPPGEARLFLLKADPGTGLPEHTHTGTELTLVLQGSFSHQAGRFGPGDIEEADALIAHQPMVDEGQPCICLVAMDGQLRLKGLLGRLLQPFVRL